jgi:hypothetical protein
MKRLIQLLLLPMLVLAFQACSKNGSSLSTDPGGTGGGTIGGHVIDAGTGHAIAGAIVSTDPATQSVGTDSNGLYKITGVATGGYVVTATKGGYANRSVNVTMAGGQQVTADIALNPGETNNPPRSPSSPIPGDGLSGTPTNIRLGWICSDPDNDPLLYDVYLDKVSPPQSVIARDQTVPGVDRGGLDTGTTYYWYVVAKDGRGESTSSPIWRFKTGIGSGTPGNAGGTALAFSSDGQNVRVAPTPDLNLSQGNMTVEAWVRPTLVNDTWHWVVCKGNSNDNLDYLFGLDRTNRFFFQTRNLTNPILADGMVTPNQWYHIAGVQDVEAGTISIYVNGELAGSKTLLGSGISSDSPLFIGGRNLFGSGRTGEGFIGTIDEVRIWNTARSAADIKGYMYRRLAGQEPGLIGYWRFDEGNGSLASDASRGNHPGTLSNGPQWVQSAAPLQ